MPSARLPRDGDKKFPELFEEHPQPMWIVDSTGQRYLAINRAAVELFGYPLAKFLEMSPASIEILEPGNTPASHHRYRTATGRTVDVRETTNEIEHAGKAAYLVMLTDVSDLHLIEERLRQAQKMEAVGMLAGGIAHDFNNLLTIINGYSQLLLMKLEGQDPNRLPVEQIMKAGERAAALTQQLLAYSRRQAIAPKVLDANSVVAGMSTMLRRLIGEDVDLRIVLADNSAHLRGDQGQLEQALLNLVVNARDAMPQGGILRIETARTGATVRITVADNGHGMDEATRSRIFDPFFTTKVEGKGTGLGLYSVHGIAKRMGGVVEVASAKGKGTAVTLSFPAVEEVETVEAAPAVKRSRRGSETVLVVEDDEAVRMLVRETLEREGYKVFDAADPAEARRMAENWRGPVHVMITDVILPRRSGRELATEIRGLVPDIKVIYISGYSDTAISNTGIEEHEVAFLRKPFTPSALVQTVRDVLENSGKIRHAGG